MTGREKKSSSSSKPAPVARQSTFFINGQGIDREVITTDICRYLGNDALVKPGTHQDPKTGQTQEGFYITAYRAPTSAQLQDLRNDSQKWQEERRRTSSRGAPPLGGYDQSATRQEAMHGSSQADFRGNNNTAAYRETSTQAPYSQSMTAPNLPPSSGYGYPVSSMAPPPPPGNFNTWSNPPAPQYGQENYSIHSSAPLATVNYQPQPDRDRMDPNTQPRQMMPPANYNNQGQMPGQAPTQYGSGRGAAPYYLQGTQPMNSQQATQYGSTAMNQEPYYGRAPATAQDGHEDNYDDDYEEMQYETTPAAAPAPAPGGSRQRDSREREHESKRHHSRR